MPWKAASPAMDARQMTDHPEDLLCLYIWIMDHSDRFDHPSIWSKMHVKYLVICVIRKFDSSRFAKKKKVDQRILEKLEDNKENNTQLKLFSYIIYFPKTRKSGTLDNQVILAMYSFFHASTAKLERRQKQCRQTFIVFPYLFLSLKKRPSTRTK